MAITSDLLSADTPYCKQGRIDQSFIKDNVASLNDSDFFICGPDLFMRGMFKNLVDLGVAKNRIHQESFSVTPVLPLKNKLVNIFLVYGLSFLFFIFLLLLISGNLNESEYEDDEYEDDNNWNTNPSVTSDYNSRGVLVNSVQPPRTKVS